MGQLRIRWGWLARGVGILAGGLVALQVLPGLLAPPEAPPLAADVGLPRVARGGAAAVPAERAEDALAHEPNQKPKPRPSRGIAAATAVIGTTPRRHARRPRRKSPPRKPTPRAAPAPTPPRSAVPAPPPAAPPPPSEPAPVTPPPAPPPAPEDGSLEFAPH